MERRTINPDIVVLNSLQIVPPSAAESNARNIPQKSFQRLKIKGKMDFRTSAFNLLENRWRDFRAAKA